VRSLPDGKEASSAKRENKVVEGHHFSKSLEELMSDTLFVPPKRITDHLYTLNLRKLRISEGYTEVITSVGSDKFIDRDYRLSIVIGLLIDKRSISIIIIDKSGS
jgi:hypothetical protein